VTDYGNTLLKTEAKSDSVNPDQKQRDQNTQRKERKKRIR